MIIIIEPFQCFTECEGQSHTDLIETSVYKPQLSEEKGEPKRGIEPTSVPRLTHSVSAGPQWLMSVVEFKSNAALRPHRP